MYHIAVMFLPVSKELQFELMTGRAPVDDDLERTFCDKAGEIGHNHCGYCSVHDKPHFVCGCLNVRLST